MIRYYLKSPLSVPKVDWQVCFVSHVVCVTYILRNFDYFWTFPQRLGVIVPHLTVLKVIKM